MKRIYQFILVAAIICVAAPFISSCSSDQDVNEWDMRYVSIRPADYLRPIPSFSLKHSTVDGITGAVDFSFVAAVHKPVDTDITVDFEAVCEELPEGIINLSAKSAVIKAGNTTSEPINLSVTDWTKLESVSDAVNYTLKIKITGITASCQEIKEGTSYQEITLNISKTEEKPPVEVMLTNVGDWIFTFMEGVEGAGANTVAGTGGSDVATNGVPFWLTVDLTETKTITGVYTRHWGAAFAPTKVEVFYSKDGREWTSITERETSGNRQEIKFDTPVVTRYLKYQMIDVPARVDITYFYLYSWE